MATYDSALGMWKDKQGGFHASQSEAIEADRNLIDDSDFYVGDGRTGYDAQAPDAPTPAADPRDQPNPNNPGGISDNEYARRSNAITRDSRATGNVNSRQDRTSGTGAVEGAGGGATGAYNAGSAAGRASFDYMHELGSPGAISSGRDIFNQFGERVGVSHAGDAVSVNPFAGGVAWTPEQLIENTVRRATKAGTTADGMGGRPVSDAVATASARSDPYTQFDGMTGGPPGFGQGDGRTGVDKETADAKTEALDTIEQNRDENAQLFADAFARYDNLDPSDYGMSDEARGYQREGLAQQRLLLQKMLGFDEKQFASQYADQTLSRQIAAGRSAGGGYASQQAGMFAAGEQAPGMYAEGQRQASALGNQRLQMAEQASKAFGDLGTMTRGQDEARTQFESNLGLGIADSVARLTEGNVQMNDRDSQQMAEIWMDFAKLQSVYEGMTSDEQIAWWQNETAKRGQDKNFDAIMAQLKSAGAISSKDLIGGLFQLGGGALTTAGGIGNAYMQGQTARDVARINAGAA